MRSENDREFEEDIEVYKADDAIDGGGLKQVR